MQAESRAPLKKPAGMLLSMKQPGHHLTTKLAPAQNSGTVTVVTAAKLSFADTYASWRL
jgi:hypothetical protein